MTPQSDLDRLQAFLDGELPAEELAAIEAHCSLLVAMGCTVLVYAETSGGIAGDRRRPLSARPRLMAAGWISAGG